jgi:predicted DNA-binding transcriptional regulator YafY
MIAAAMDRTERFYKIQQLLRQRRVVPLADFLSGLEVSRATFKRDIEYLRDRMNVPIEWDRDAGGYCLAEQGGAPSRSELPGLWFNASEVHALLTMQHLLKGLEPGILAPQVAPLLERLQGMLASDDQSPAEVERRIRIIRIASRPVSAEYFSLVAGATLRRRRMHITYHARSSDVATERDVSPQRMVFYRGNWYVDAWCHLRGDLRSFALDAIRSATVLDEKAKDMPEKELDAFLSSGYGIFAGRQVEWATLRFSPAVKRWVSAEQWHPKQKAGEEPDGSWLLELPYNQPRELVMDILRWGPEVEVLGPMELREEVRAQLRAAAKFYG